MAEKLPGYTLGQALEMVETVNTQFGGTCSPAELATKMGTNIESGAFKMRWSAARQFGLLDRVDKNFTITDRGKRALNESLRQSALVEAFRDVPSYDKLYSEYVGTALPSEQGLNNRLYSMGVPMKSLERIRKAFLRSASDAGLYDAELGMLINLSEPVAGPVADVSVAAEPVLPTDDDHPILAALWDEKPAKGCDRRKFDGWFKMLEDAFIWVYDLEEKKENGQKQVPSEDSLKGAEPGVRGTS